MQDLYGFFTDNWKPFVLLIGLAAAVWYVMKNKEKLFYNKPWSK